KSPLLSAQDIVLLSRIEFLLRGNIGQLQSRNLIGIQGRGAGRVFHFKVSHSGSTNGDPIYFSARPPTHPDAKWFLPLPLFVIPNPWCESCVLKVESLHILPECRRSSPDFLSARGHTPIRSSVPAPPAAKFRE